MSNILDSLYKEYEELSQKLKKIADVIVAYGGTIPEDAEPTYNEDELAWQLLMGDYPKNGTWREKILFALEKEDMPITVSDLAVKINQLEPNLGLARITNALTQYCSSMGVTGELDVKKGYRNKYSIPKK